MSTATPSLFFHSSSPFRCWPGTIATVTGPSFFFFFSSLPVFSLSLARKTRSFPSHVFFFFLFFAPIVLEEEPTIPALLSFPDFLFFFLLDVKVVAFLPAVPFPSPSRQNELNRAQTKRLPPLLFFRLFFSSPSTAGASKKEEGG